MIEDYVHVKWLEIALIIGIKAAALFLGIATIYAVVAVALGG